jgi:hypothetical protein
MRSELVALLVATAACSSAPPPRPRSHDVARGTRSALWDNARGGFFAAEALPMSAATEREHPVK